MNTIESTKTAVLIYIFNYWFERLKDHAITIKWLLDKTVVFHIKVNFIEREKKPVLKYKLHNCRIPISTNGRVCQIMLKY